MNTQASKDTKTAVNREGRVDVEIKYHLGKRVDGDYRTPESALIAAGFDGQKASKLVCRFDRELGFALIEYPGDDGERLLVSRQQGLFRLYEVSMTGFPDRRLPEMLNALMLDKVYPPAEWVVIEAAHCIHTHKVYDLAILRDANCADEAGQ